MLRRAALFNVFIFASPGLKDYSGAVQLEQQRQKETVSKSSDEATQVFTDNAKKATSHNVRQYPLCRRHQQLRESHNGI